MIVPPSIVNCPLSRFWTVALTSVVAIKYAVPLIVAVPPLLYKACLSPKALIVPPVIDRVPVLLTAAVLIELVSIVPLIIWRFPAFVILLH